MTSKDIYRCLGGLDPLLIEKAAPQERVQKKNVILRWAALAACLALVASAVLGIPLLMKEGQDPPEGLASGEISSESAGDEGSTAETIDDGTKLTGKQELFWGTFSSEEYDWRSSGSGIRFKIQTVVEAEVVEILPASYSLVGGVREYHVIKLRVMESIRGSGIPEEIFLRFSYWKDPTVFEGYDRFILSLQQVGIENHMMVNDSARKIEYFPNMFEGASGSIKGGCVIAFNDGVLDERYWKEMYTIDKYPLCVESRLDGPNSDYPATRNSTIQEVKSNIRSLVEENKSVYARRYDYLRAEDLFLSKEAKEVRAYVAPGKNNAFAQTLTVGKEEVSIEYTRVINGFETNEVICVNGYERGQGSVTRTGEAFMEADLESIPDLGEVLENITFFDLGDLWPAHVSLSEFRLRRVYARGFYCKAEGVAYGFVRVSWYYERLYSVRPCSVTDISYYLCDEKGKGTIVEKEELKELIGAQAYNELFPYDD